MEVGKNAECPEAEATNGHEPANVVLGSELRSSRLAISKYP